MVEQRTWREFQDTGMLWVINRTLHIFGWSIVFDVSETDEILSVYPARVGWRGFQPEIDDEGFRKVSQYMVRNADQLAEEAEED